MIAPFRQMFYPFPAAPATGPKSRMPHWLAVDGILRYRPAPVVTPVMPCKDRLPQRRGAPMTQTDPGQNQQPVVSNTSMALIVYILYFVAYFVGITAIVG